MKKDEIVVQDIIAACKKLMQKHGLDKITMEDIAKATGKGKSTLYYYFKNRDEIVDRAISHEMDYFFNIVKTSVDQQKDAVAMLKTYIVMKIKTLRDKINLYHVAFENELAGGRLHKEFAKLRARYDNEEKQLIVSILTKGVNDKVFKKEIMSEVDMLGELFVASVRGVELDIIIHNKLKTLSDKADLLVNILTKGIER